MNIVEETRPVNNSSKAVSTWQKILPPVTLLLLAPAIAELLFGSTHITVLFAFVPEIGIYGCLALVFRYLVRKRQRGWFAILLLGIAFAIAEECLIQQTSLAPLIGVNPAHIYGRVFGVNWIYFIWAVGYESVWGILIPIYLTELIFPNQRTYLWISKRGASIAIIVFVFTAIIVWFTWTQVAAPLYFHQPPYQPSMFIILIALISILFLIFMALKSNLATYFHQKQKNLSLAPKPQTLGIITCLAGLSWFLLVLLAYGADTSLPVVVPIIVSIGMAGISIFLMRYWSNSSNWNDEHRVYLISGAIIANMVAGFVASGISLPIDFIGKLILDIIAVIMLVYLTKRINTHNNDQVRYQSTS